jgi:type II secretion system protein N
MYPAFYVGSLLLFVYATFPHDQLRDRLVREFNASERGSSGSRLELDDLSWHWFTGLEAEGVRWIRPPDAASGEGGEGGLDAKNEKPRVLELDAAYASVSVLRWLFGTLSLSFGAEGLGGEIDGSFVDTGELREIEVELEELDVGQTPLAGMIGLPLTGILNGTAELVLPEGQLANANGKVELRMEGLVIGDGKAKIKNAIAIPAVNAGELELEAEAEEGKLEIRRFTLRGPDIEVTLDGRIRLRDPFDSSLAELSLSFKFSDAYRNKSDVTRGLLGAPSSTVPGAFDLDPQNRAAKSPDGSYGWRVTGALSNLRFNPSRGAGRATSGAATRRRATSPLRPGEEE